MLNLLTVASLKDQNKFLEQIFQIFEIEKRKLIFQLFETIFESPPLPPISQRQNMSKVYFAQDP